MNELYIILQEVKRQWGIETVNAIKQKIRFEGAVFTSELIDSIGLNQDDTLDGNITFKMADYGKFIDEGVNGVIQNRGSQYSFKGNWKGTAVAIKQWADAKGLNNWALGHSIQKKGIKPRMFFNSVIESRLPQLPIDIQTAYTNYLTNVINRQQNP